MSPGRDKLVRKRDFLALNVGDSWVSHQVFFACMETWASATWSGCVLRGGGRFFFFLQGTAPNPPARNPAQVSRALNAVSSALSPTKSPLLSICKQLNSACIMCEPVMAVPHCALPCSQPSTPAAQGSGCYCCHYALPSPTLLLAELEAHPWCREECLLVLIGGHGWTVTVGEYCVSFNLHQVPAVMADVGVGGSA